MIAQLTGILVAKSPNAAVVEVHGVGFHVLVSLPCFYDLPEPGKQVSLFTHLHVREDAVQLFGFLDPLERALFQLLIGVAGIGPKLALNILSGLPARELEAALDAGDVARLVSIPGVGRKTAERLVLELREKARALRGEGEREERRGGDVDREAVSALINLGYRRADAELAVKSARAAGADDLESAIRQALRRLSG